MRSKKIFHFCIQFKHMKRIVSIVILLALVLGVTACSGSGGQDSPDFEAKNIQWISAASASKESRVDGFTTVCEKDHRRHRKYLLHTLRRAGGF